MRSLADPEHLTLGECFDLRDLLGTVGGEGKRWSKVSPRRSAPVLPRASGLLKIGTFGLF